MPLIKHGRVVANDPWIRLADDAPAPADADIIVTPARLAADGRALAARPGRLGVIVSSAEGPEEIAEHIDRLALVALEFPTFSDGRAYSSARLLRRRFGFEGELRAVGEVLRDQVFFMARCGIDAFEMDGVAAAQAAQSFAAAQNEFRFVYQSAADQRAPVWSRRLLQSAVIAAQ